MKKVLVIFLVCVFAIYIGGMQVTYWFKIDNAKEKALTHIKDHKVDNSETKAFTFTKHQYDKLNWNEKDKEFSYNGVDYDVLNICHSGSNITVICYKDDLETEVSSVFNKLFDRFFSPQQQSKNTENNIAGKIFKEYLPQEYLAHTGIQETETEFIFEEKHCNSFSLIESKWHPPTLC